MVLNCCRRRVEPTLIGAQWVLLDVSARGVATGGIIGYIYPPKISPSKLVIG